MGRRNQHDVFVIGDEQLAAETPVPPDHERIAPIDDQAPDGSYPPGLDRPLRSGSTRLRRWPAAIVLAAVPATVLALLELSAGTASDQEGPQTSAPTATVSAPPPRGPVPPPAVPASPVGRDQNGHRPAPVRRPNPSPGGEPEREPIHSEAPVSSPSGISAPPSSPSTPIPVSPTPTVSGGSGEEQFGFER